MRALFALSAVALTLSAGAAFAQQQPIGQRPLTHPARVVDAPRGATIPQSYNWEWEELLRGSRYIDTQSFMQTVSASRMERASRVILLVEKGECDAARRVANAEGDRTMALRVRRICRADS